MARCLVLLFVLLASVSAICGCPQNLKHNHDDAHTHRPNHQHYGQSNSTESTIVRRAVTYKPREMTQEEMDLLVEQAERNVETEIPIDMSNDMVVVTIPDSFLEVNRHARNISSPGDVGGDCSCGIFPTMSPMENDSPLMRKIIDNITCFDSPSEHQKVDCTSNCIDFAKNYHNEIRNTVCVALHNATNLQAYLHTKLCGQTWTYADMECLSPICCQDREPNECEAPPEAVA